MTWNVAEVIFQLFVYLVGRKVAIWFEHGGSPSGVDKDGNVKVVFGGVSTTR